MQNIYKNTSKIKYHILTILKCMVFAILITIVASLLFGYKYLNVVTGSMSPTINVNALIVVNNANVNQVNSGDVIVFTQGDLLVTHRVVDVTTQNGKVAFVTKGDANNMVDANLVTEQNFEGVVVFHVENLGGIIYYLRQNILLIMVILMAGFVLYYLI